MPAYDFKKIVLDYAGVRKKKKILANLSTVAAAGEFLWTASDEGRTVECLKLDGKHYRLHRQIDLDGVFPRLPGRKMNGEKEDEADIESIDIADGRLWICGSHCRVRLQPDENKPDVLQHEFRSRPSRCLFGSIGLSGDGGTLADNGTTLPFHGTGTLRHLLTNNLFLKPFINLPSKENGLDIEGMVVVKDHCFFGLRGPIVDSIAVVMEVPITDGLRIAKHTPITHFLDLGGLGIRDLAHDGRDLLVLAGPVSKADGPFRIFHWRPRHVDHVQKPREPILDDWTNDGEHPEGICRLERHGKPGLLILYDSPDERRITGNQYEADWYRWPA